jgi:hypothetical protein
MIGFINTLLYNLSITINYSTIANLPLSQITRTCYPFPDNGFITGTITSNQYEVFLSFPIADNSEDLTQFSSDYCCVLLQLPALEFASLMITLHGPNRKHSPYCWWSLFTAPLPSNIHPIVACSCVAGMCLPSCCLAMVIVVITSIHIPFVSTRFTGFSVILKLGSGFMDSDQNIMHGQKCKVSFQMDEYVISS